MRVMVFDTETTGLPERNCSIYQHDKYPYILQLSYVIYDTDNNRICVIKDDYVKIDHSVEISPRSLEIHHITREKCLAEGKPISQLMLEFNQYLKTVDVVVGHNISFDKKMIFVECIRNNVQQQFTWFRGNMKIQRPEYCTMKNTTDFCGIEKPKRQKIMKVEEDKNEQNNNEETSKSLEKKHYKFPKLTELHYKLFEQDVNPEILHNSKIDVLITLKCYMKYVHNVDLSEHPIFQNLINKNEK